MGAKVNANTLDLKDGTLQVAQKVARIGHWGFEGCQPSIRGSLAGMRCGGVPPLAARQFARTKNPQLRRIHRSGR